MHKQNMLGNKKSIWRQLACQQEKSEASLIAKKAGEGFGFSCGATQNMS